MPTLTATDETGWVKKRGRREPFHGTFIETFEF